MVQLFYHPLLDSTNRLAKELAWQGAAPGTVVQAAQQSAGRGQYERSFLSPLGGLYFSLILRPTLQAQEVAMVTLAAGLGCRDAISDQCQLRTRIKWPNDLYCKEKKIAGILSEYWYFAPTNYVCANASVVVLINVNYKHRHRKHRLHLYPDQSDK